MPPSDSPARWHQVSRLPDSVWASCGRGRRRRDPRARPSAHHELRAIVDRGDGELGFCGRRHCSVASLPILWRCNRISAGARSCECTGASVPQHEPCGTRDRGIRDARSFLPQVLSPNREHRLSTAPNLVKPAAATTETGSFLPPGRAVLSIPTYRWLLLREITQARVRFRLQLASL